MLIEVALFAAPVAVGVRRPHMGAESFGALGDADLERGTAGLGMDDAGGGA